MTKSFIPGPLRAADISPHRGGIPVGVVVTDIFTPRPHKIFMGPSKCSWAINFVIFQLEFHVLCEVTKLDVILSFLFGLAPQAEDLSALYALESQGPPFASCSC